MSLPLPTHAYSRDAADPAERCSICGRPQRHALHNSYGVVTPARAELYARPAAPGCWSVGVLAVAADGTRRFAEVAYDLPTAQAQRWLDARRATRIAA